ncbi:MAG: hypothetical protein IJ329_02285 [Clostridia bacterium]|nr:hypothetical protein [Clostridia bacterium]
MISVYTDADYLAAYKQKQRIFTGFWAMTCTYLAICIAMLVYHISLPYAAKEDVIPKIITYVFTGAYFVIIFPYMSIKYSRVRRYCKMLFYVCEGLKMEESNYFYTFRTKNLQKDHIDVVGCAFETWSKKRQEWQEREVYFDVEKPLPGFESGDYVRYISQSNFLVQYEILEKHAYEFSEYEEDEETEEETDETVEATEETEGEEQ